MRIVFISDTHLKHNELQLSPGDLLIHAGDFSRKGLLHEAQAFLDWFSGQPFQYKIFIAGNHDFIAEREPALFESMIPENVIYLNDSGVTVGDIRIWGSPIQPWFYDWAFNRQRGADIRRHWDLIPADTELLITHGPPYGILDEVVRDPRPVGCRDLLHKVSELQHLKAHVFGHIHEGYGQREVGGTLFLNASVLDVGYEMKNKPFLVDWGRSGVAVFDKNN